MIKKFTLFGYVGIFTYKHDKYEDDNRYWTFIWGKLRVNVAWNNWVPSWLLAEEQLPEDY